MLLRERGEERRSSSGAPSPVRIVSTPRGSVEQPLDDRGRDLVEVAAAGDRLALEQAEERALLDRQAVQLRRRATRS